MATCNASTLLTDNPFTELDPGLMEAVKLQLLCDISASGGGGGGGGVPTSRTISTTSPLQGGGDLSANRTLSILQASGAQNGFLSSTDWTTFNGKIGGSGTSGTFARFSASGTITDSAVLTESAGVMTASGPLTFSGTTHAGIRVNNLTTAQRDAIGSPAAGMLIWNTTTGRLNTHNGTVWMDGFVRLTGDTMTGALGITQGAITADTPAINITSTFNNAGVTFSGVIKADVTDTASNASSLLLSLGVGGTPLFRVLKTGTLYVGSGNGGIAPVAGGNFDAISNGVAMARFTGTAVSIRSDGTFQWSSTTGTGGTPDVILARDAADSLALRRTTNAQRFDIYNTFTSSTNHERLALRWNSGVATIETQKGSGGGTAQVLIFGTDSTERLRLDTNGNVVVNTAAIATNATNGFLYVPSCAGTPTGTPTTFTGRVPIVVDTTNNKLYFYSGAAWRDAGP